MKFQNNGSLLPQGEGQDEGVIEIIVLAPLIPLTPTLSLRERELTGRQCWKI